MIGKTGMTSKLIAIGSGKGGVGKTLTTMNLAMSFAKDGAKVLILDGDMGLSNVDVLAGKKTDKTIDDIILNGATIADIVFPVAQNISLISSGSGLFNLANLPRYKRQILFDQMQSYRSNDDVILIDTAAGISDQVLQFHQASDLSVIVATPEPHSLTDAYALIKILSEEINRKEFYVIINQARTIEEGQHVFLRLNEVAIKFLKTKLTFLGTVTHDPALHSLILRRQILSDKTLKTVAGQNWIEVASNLRAAYRDVNRGSNVQELFNSMIWTREGGAYESSRQAL